MKPVFILIACSLFCMGLCAEEIKGAFGYRLGEIFQGTAENGMTSFVPKKKYRHFSDYIINVSKDKKISSVEASATFPDDEDGRALAKKEYSEIRETLLKNYGKKMLNSDYKKKDFWQCKFKDSASREVTLVLDLKEKKCYLSLVYIDIKLFLDE